MRINILLLILLCLVFGNGCISLLCLPPDTPGAEQPPPVVGLGDVLGGMLIAHDNEKSPSGNLVRGLGIGAGILIVDIFVAHVLFDYDPIDLGGFNMQMGGIDKEHDPLCAINKLTFVPQPDLIRHYELVILPNVNSKAPSHTMRLMSKGLNSGDAIHNY